MKYRIEVYEEERRGRLGAALKPMELRVRYDNGDPVSHLPVKFRLINGSGRFEHRDALTDAQGCAIAEFVPNEAGPYRIDCLVGGKGGEAVHFTGEVAGMVETAEAEETRAEQPAETPAATEAPVSTAAVLASADEVLDSLLQGQAEQEAAAATQPTETAAAPAGEAVQETAAGSEAETTPVVAAVPEEAPTIPKPLPVPIPLPPEFLDRQNAGQPAAEGTAASEPATEPAVPEEAPAVIVDPELLSAAAATAAEVAPEAAEPVQTEQAPEQRPTETAAPATDGGNVQAPEPDVVQIQPEAVPAPDDADEADLPAVTASWPKTRDKAVIAGISVAAAMLLALLVGHAVKSIGETAPAAVTRSVDCTGSPVKQVGHRYVFEKCVVKP